MKKLGRDCSECQACWKEGLLQKMEFVIELITSLSNTHFKIYLIYLKYIIKYIYKNTAAIPDLKNKLSC